MLFLREAMPYHRVFCLILLTLCSILVPAVLAEYPQDSVPTLWNEPPEVPSGAGPFDAATTTARLSDATAFPPYTSELEPEDTTHLHRLDAGDGERLREGLPAAPPSAAGMSSRCICSVWVCHLPGGVKATLLGRGRVAFTSCSWKLPC
ncbi:protein SNORC isoform X1 [Catharus ustulatus]|uniref:protein SNORC isoform X1 n=1 Tax=Catharus ustulatus TaxID=91951 RepID=UPI00140E2E64|nr:protein SNORC isoform X1 [Catharus ustulatus]XP_032924299.1 protein SNORC isoform X1 [Catharus ustulatus]